MWLSASAFYYQYYRVYSPVAFGKKTDPRGDYIRKYCPELKHFPSDLIYEPWKATAGEQRQYQCKIGEDYPNRVVIHEMVQNINMGRMKRAYQAHNSQQDPEDYEPPSKVRVKDEVPTPFMMPNPVKVEVKEEPISDDDDEFC